MSLDSSADLMNTSGRQVQAAAEDSIENLTHTGYHDEGEPRLHPFDGAHIQSTQDEVAEQSTEVFSPNSEAILQTSLHLDSLRTPSRSPASEDSRSPRSAGGDYHLASHITPRLNLLGEHKNDWTRQSQSEKMPKHNLPDIVSPSLAMRAISDSDRPRKRHRFGTESLSPVGPSSSQTPPSPPKPASGPEIYEIPDDVLAFLSDDDPVEVTRQTRDEQKRFEQLLKNREKDEEYARSLHLQLSGSAPLRASSGISTQNLSQASLNRQGQVQRHRAFENSPARPTRPGFDLDIIPDQQAATSNSVSAIATRPDSHGRPTQSAQKKPQTGGWISLLSDDDSDGELIAPISSGTPGLGSRHALSSEPSSTTRNIPPSSGYRQPLIPAAIQQTLPVVDLTSDTVSWRSQNQPNTQPLQSAISTHSRLPTVRSTFSSAPSHITGKSSSNAPRGSSVHPPHHVPHLTNAQPSSSAALDPYSKFTSPLMSSALNLFQGAANIIYGGSNRPTGPGNQPFFGGYSSAHMLDDDDSSDDEGYGLDEGRDRVYEYLNRRQHQSSRSSAAMAEYESFNPQKARVELQSLLENIRPDESFEGGENTPESMVFQLMPHQKLGLAWLKQMEAGETKGGILADDMGLGKTIQALALMISNRSEDPACKTNLIIAPVALLKQWEREIKTKLKPGPQHELKTLIMHGQAKNQTWEQLQSYDVVLTTFGTIAIEYKRKMAIMEKQARNPNYVPHPKLDYLPTMGPHCKWFRIIVDEAQCIKNRRTKSALAAASLNAINRWCMTGTPMMNNIDELYSLIRFLRVSPWQDLHYFSVNFSRPLKGHSKHARERAMEKLRVLLKTILLRRTKKSSIDGKPILQLPEKIVEQVHGEFNEDEKAVYKALETKSQMVFNRYMKAGTVGKNYSNILVLLLRLRQCCCHPHLVRDFSGETSGTTSQKMLDLAKTLAPDVVNRLKEMSRSTEEGHLECPICMDPIPNSTIFLPCGHNSCSECFARISDPNNALINGFEDRDGVFKCPSCRGEVANGDTIDHETFKKVHMPEHTTLEGTDDDDDSDEQSEDEDEDSEDDGEDLRDFIDDGDVADETSDENGSVTKGNTKAEKLGDQADAVAAGAAITPIGEVDAAGPSDATTDDEDQNLTILELIARTRSGEEVPRKTKVDKSSKAGSSKVIQKSTGKATGKGKGKSKGEKKRNKGKGRATDEPKSKMTLARLKAESSKNAKNKRRYLRRLERDWEPSTKIDKTLEILRRMMNSENTRPELPAEKVIIFSQFTSLLDLLEVPIMAENWNCRRYDGSMSSNARNEAVMDFTDRPDIRIMLVSLKAGNAGLNLTAASNVIMFDPFWNPYIEEQAIDRAYRIGQVRPVNVHRILIQATVEDRILQLQEEKRALIESALDEGAAQRIGRLGTRDLAFLFDVPVQ